jgi:hypothetical protein
MIAPNQVSAKEIVDSLLLRLKDVIGVNRALYMSYAKDVFKELNLRGIKSSKRVVLKINKTLNSVPVPGDYVQYSSAYVFDDCGKLVPVLINSDISEEIIDLAADKKCDCGSDLCANLKNYELIEEPVLAPMPDGEMQSFTKTSIKKINKDGSYELQTSTPVTIFDDEGNHIATRLETQTEFLCKLEVDGNGCVIENEKNRGAVYTYCGFQDINHECGCPPKRNECKVKPTFNISDDGHRLIFPSDFPYDYIVLRYYYDVKTKDILVPYVAKRVFMDKIYYEGIRYDPKVALNLKLKTESDISKGERNLLSDLSRMTTSRLYSVISPKRN